MAKYIDLGDETEDARIRQIGNAVMQGNLVVFCTDDEPGKADRYIAKLKKRFPAIRVVDRFEGPVEGVVSVKVQLPKG